METIDQKDLSLDTADLNRNVQYFCGSVLLYYQDILNDRELFVCKLLIKGHSLHGVSKTLGLPSERIRQIFHKAIRKVRDAFQETIKEVATLKDENEKLKHHNLILEKEILSAQSLENVKSIMGQECTLCKNAKQLLNTPVSKLPLPLRVKNVLESAKVSMFSEIPLLSKDVLLNIKKCGKKTINDLQVYLHRFSLEMDMAYEDIISRMAKLSDEDISSDNFKSYTRVYKEEDIDSFVDQESVATTEETVQAQNVEIPQKADNTNNITLDDICAEIGPSKKGKKKWGRKVKQILLNNNIDTLEKLLSLKPEEFMDFEGVGKTTLYYTRKAIESFGIIWSDVFNEDRNIIDM